MKTHFLIIFIIFNMLTINMASAVNSYDIENEHHELEPHNSSDLALSNNEPDCNHLCHISSHMVGLVSLSAIRLFFTTAHSVAVRSHQKTVSLVLPQPSRPPKA